MNADRDVQAVVFDAFGTLVRIGTRLGPYRALQKVMADYGRPIQPDDAVMMMTAETGLAGIVQRCGVTVPVSELAPIEENLYRELSTIRLFDDATAAVMRARRRGLKIAICSNLAAPYGAVVMALLPQFDAYAWSFRVGTVKPDPHMYAYVAGALGCAPSRILFVGDTVAADVTGPRAAGMTALHLDRGPQTRLDGSLKGLDELFA